MVSLEMKLIMKVTSDKEGAEPPLPRIAVERTPEVEPRTFYVSSADTEAHGHTGGCLGCTALTSHGRATKPHNNGCRERMRTIIERTLTGTARMNEDGVAETERGVGDVPLASRTEEQMRIDMRSHLAKTRDNSTSTE